MNKIILYFIIGLCSLFDSSLAQVPGIGKCPKINAVQNFDIDRYSGLWIDVYKYPFLFSIGGRCITANYVLNPDSTVTVINKQIRNGQEDSVIGTAKVVTPGIGSLTVTFSGMPFSQEGNYNVIYTDYDDLSVVYSCSSILGFLNLKSMWILTRSRFPSSETINKAYEVLKANGISTTFISETDQKNCPEQALKNLQ